MACLAEHMIFTGINEDMDTGLCKAHPVPQDRTLKLAHSRHFAAGTDVSAVPTTEATAGVSGGGASVHSDTGVATGKAFTGGCATI